MDPEKAAQRDSQFREYETNRKDSQGNNFKSRRGAKASDQEDGNKAKTSTNWQNMNTEYMNRSSTTSYDF